MREAGGWSVTLVTATPLASSTEPLWGGRLGVQHFLEVTTGRIYCWVEGEEGRAQRSGQTCFS